MSRKKKIMVMFLAMAGMGVGVGTGAFLLKTKILPRGADDSDTYQIIPMANITNNANNANSTILSMKIFEDKFERNETLIESGTMKTSTSRDWWLNSGGVFYTKDGIGSTAIGDLPGYNRWRLAYGVSNPTDTGDGYRPQNIFRLVSRSTWKNFEESVYFRVKHTNMTDSPQRNESNGVQLFNRYLDGKNLYYVGLRVDGDVVVKKKLKGVYKTLGNKEVFAGAYDRDQRPNVLPMDTWIGLKSVVSTERDGRVRIDVWVDTGAIGEWKQVLSVYDDTEVLDTAGFAGIRTDFMDVEFREFRVVEKE